MAKGRDRPRHQEKRKPKAKAAKFRRPSAYEAPMSVEVIKTKRKPRSEPERGASDLQRPPGAKRRRSPEDDGSPGGRGPERASPAERRARPRGRCRHPPDRKAVRARRDHAARRQGRAPGGGRRCPPARWPWTSPWAWVASARPDHRDLRPRVERQDDALLPHRCERPARRRDRCLHRRGARAGSHVRGQRGRQRRRAPGQPAGHRRAGARDRGDADPQQRRGRGHRGLGGRARAARRDRGRDGGQLHRPPGTAHEPGAAQADRRDQPLQYGARLHEPAAREDRRHVRKPRDDAGRARAEVLR